MSEFVSLPCGEVITLPPPRFWSFVRVVGPLGDGTYDARVVSYQPPPTVAGQWHWQDHGPTVVLVGNGVPPVLGNIYAGTRENAIAVVINPEPCGFHSPP